MKRELIIYVSILALSIPAIMMLYKRRKAKMKLKKSVLSDNDINYNATAKNIAMSIARSKELYKELIVKVHPDKFLDERKERATELSAKITQAKKNFDELKRIENEVAAFLHNPDSL